MVSVYRGAREGIPWHHWYPDAAPLLFGTTDDGFSDKHAKDVILKARKHLVGMMEERYLLPPEVEQEHRKKAHIAGNKEVLQKGYALVGSEYKPILLLEEDITGNFSDREGVTL